MFNIPIHCIKATDLTVFMAIGLSLRIAEVLGMIPGHFLIKTVLKTLQFKFKYNFVDRNWKLNPKYIKIMSTTSALCINPYSNLNHV